jgi:hypothetical protein
MSGFSGSFLFLEGCGSRELGLAAYQLKLAPKEHVANHGGNDKQASLHKARISLNTATEQPGMALQTHTPSATAGKGKQTHLL